jgi:hypothetical protein
MSAVARSPFCTQCGTRLADELAFCTSCGAPAGPAPAPPTPGYPADLGSTLPDQGGYPGGAGGGYPPEPGYPPERGYEPGYPPGPGGWAEPERRSRPGLAVVGVVVLVLALVAGGVTVLAMRRTAAGGPAATPSASPSASGSPAPYPAGSYPSAPLPAPSYSPAGGDLSTQAAALDALLSNSVASRAAVVQAAAQIGACTSLDSAKSAMLAAAATRESAASAAGSLSVNALPNSSGLVGLLVQMMQASASADRSYAAWADDAASGQCRGGSAVHTANFTAAEAASSQATSLKQQFAATWAPIAAQAHLPARTADQL